MSDRVNAVFIGFGKDEFGFECEVLEDAVTKKRYAAYSLEVWEERVKYLNWLLTEQERRDGRPTFSAD